MGHAIIYTVTVGVGQLVSLLLLPVVTHFLTPHLYGEYVLVLANTALVGTFGSAWVRNVAMRLHFEFARSERLGTFFWTAAVLQMGTVIGLLGLGYVWTRSLGEPVGLDTYTAGAVSLLVSDFYGLAVNTLRAEHRAIRFGAAEIVSGVLRLAGTWAALLIGFRSPVMLFTVASASLLVALMVIVPGLRASFSGRPAFDRRIASEIARMGLPSIPLWVGSWVITLSNRTLLAWFSDLSAVGVYSVAQSVAERAITGLATGLYLAAWPNILRTWTSEPARAPEVTAHYLGVYVMVTLGPTAALAIHRDILLSWIVGAQYQSAAGMVPLVSAGAWLVGLAGYFNRPLELEKAYGALSRLTMIAAATSIGIGVWLIPTMGALGAAVSNAAAGSAFLALSAIAGMRRQPLPIPWLAIGGGVVATIGATFASSVAPTPLSALVVFAAVYACAVVAPWYHAMKAGPRTRTAALPESPKP